MELFENCTKNTNRSLRLIADHHTKIVRIFHVGGYEILVLDNFISSGIKHPQVALLWRPVNSGRSPVHYTTTLSNASSSWPCRGIRCLERTRTVEKITRRHILAEYWSWALCLLNRADRHRGLLIPLWF